MAYSNHRGLTRVIKAFGYSWSGLRPTFRHEAAATRAAREGGYDGYIGGHIHKAAIASRDGVLYCNTGDWVEHCTALIEDRAGYLHLIHWSDHGRVDASDVSQEAAGKPAPALPPELAWLCTPSANVS